MPPTFHNPWPPVASLFDSIKIIASVPLERASISSNPNVTAIKTVNADFGVFDSLESAHSNGICWLGHAGFLVQLPSAGAGSRPTRVIFDPIFADRASPFTHVGPHRRLPPPCSIEDLPGVDFIAISHNHYDHLDIEAVAAIYKQSYKQTHTHVLVPKGVRDILISSGIPPESVSEHEWWDEKSFSRAGYSESVTFTCVPCQHNSGRGLLDQGKSHWCGWAIQVRSGHDEEYKFVTSIYHAGDTGYLTADGPCPAFKEIGERLGPFDVAMIPIWRGASLSFLGRFGLRLTDDTPLRSLHASPEDAVQLSVDVRARHSFAMHFGTFAESDIEANEPLERLFKARDVLNKGDWMVDGGFGALDIGQCVMIPCTSPIHITDKI